MIYTFYSFKGGVGRSMALANVAELLARRGLDVLVVDMDLEAPGLERFFLEGRYLVSPDDVQRRRGVIDLLTSYKDLKRLPVMDAEVPVGPGQPPFAVEPLRGFVVPLRKTDGGSIMLMPAGRREGGAYASYAELVRAFDWDDFYLRWEGETFFDWFREEALTLADVVLIDSRTGITELSGICTLHLADAVVMFVAPNRQNLDGCALLAESLREPALLEQGRRGRELKILAVPSRIDHSESDQLDLFAKDFADQLEQYMPPDLQFENSLFIDLKIPYVPSYAYRETIAVGEPERAVATELIAAYGRLSATMIALAPPDSRLQRVLRRGTDGDTRPPVGDGGVAADIASRPWVAERVRDWLTDTREPVLLITGEPGSGKTMVMRWLSTLFEAGEGGQAILPGRLLHIFHSEPFAGSDAQALIEALVRRLGRLLPDYARVVRYQRNPHIAVDVRANISATSDAQSFVDGVVLGAVSPLTAYRELICLPLMDAPTEPLLVLVDGIDAAGSSMRESMADLLSQIATGGLPSPLRFVITSRVDTRILRALPGPRFDLVADEPPGTADLRDYVARRVAAFSPDATDSERFALTELVCELSGGNFLYAASVLSGLASGEIEQPSSGVPRSLAGLFRAELTRLIGSDSALWSNDQQVLSVLAVARAPLRHSELAGIVGWPVSRVYETLERWTPYLEARGGGVALYHASFREFLLSDETFGIYADEAHQAVVRFLLRDRDVAWQPRDRSYGVEQLLPHIFEGIVSSNDRVARDWLAREAVKLLVDEDFLFTTVARGAKPLLDGLRIGARALAPLSRIPQVQAAVLRTLGEVDARLRERLASATDAASTVAELLTSLSSTVGGIYAEAYDEIRATMPPGRTRTAMLNLLVSEVRQLGELGIFDGIDAATLMDGGDGERLVALAILEVRPDPGHFGRVCDAVAASHSAFEQFHAIDVSGRMLPLLSADERRKLLGVLDAERRDVRGLGVMQDSSRGTKIIGLISRLLDEEPEGK